MDPGSFIILPKLRLREVQKSLFKARRLGTTSTKSQFRGCHEIKNCRRSILNKWKTFPWVIKMNFIPCSYWDALSFCHFSTGPLTPYPIGVSDVGFMGKDRRRSRSRSRRRCRKSMDEVKMVDKWIESQRHIYIYMERLLHILHRERSLLVFEEFPIVSCGISVLRWNSLCIIRRFVLLGLMTGNLDCILNPSLFDDSLICRDKCCRNDEESEDHGHLSILLYFIVLKVVKWCQVHLGLLLTDWRSVLQNDIVNYMLARMLDSLKSL